MIQEVYQRLWVRFLSVVGPSFFGKLHRFRENGLLLFLGILLFVIGLCWCFGLGDVCMLAMQNLRVFGLKSCV